MQPFMPGNYTAIVHGKNGATGDARVEAYQLQCRLPGCSTFPDEGLLFQTGVSIPPQRVRG